MPNDLLQKYKWQVLFILVGVSLIGLGLIYNSFNFFKTAEVEVLGEVDERQGIVVEVAGAVNSPGVYNLPHDARVEDAIKKAAGFSEDVDRDWVEKMVNRASMLTDGQKIYIKPIGEQSNGQSANDTPGSFGTFQTTGGEVSKLVNINTSSQKELESLWGIGPVTAQNIIEQRPYSDVNELLVKKIISQNVYERNRDLLTIY